MEIKELCNKLPYWNKLTSMEKEQVEKSAIIKKYEKGNIIHSCKRECLGMVMILKGSLRAYILSDEGREVTLFRLYEGSNCVMSASCIVKEITFETLITAEEDSELLIINNSLFSKLSEQNVYVKCYLYETIIKRFSDVMWTMQQILFMGFDKRLATFLIEESRRTGKRTIHMTHEQIAQNTSSAREVVARMLKRFSSEGIVELKRGSIIIKDIEKLENILE